MPHYTSGGEYTVYIGVYIGAYVIRLNSTAVVNLRYILMVSLAYNAIGLN